MYTFRRTLHTYAWITDVDTDKNKEERNKHAVTGDYLT